MENNESGRMGEWEIGRLGEWEIGRMGDWEDLGEKECILITYYLLPIVFNDDRLKTLLRVLIPSPKPISLVPLVLLVSLVSP